MPCFLSGIVAAHAFAANGNLPVEEFSHQDGHVMAALYSSGASEKLLKAPFAAFHVSGGTTEVLYVTPRQDGFDVLQIGGTADLNAGQAIDRAGVMMGLQFPCGKEMEGLASCFEGTLPSVRVSVKERTCNLSGLQNLAEKYFRETQDKAFVSAYVFEFIGKTLEQMTAQADSIYSDIPIVYAGGVMGNRALQERLGKRANTYFAHPLFSADNAAGVALLCRQRHLQQTN